MWSSKVIIVIPCHRLISKPACASAGAINHPSTRCLSRSLPRTSLRIEARTGTILQQLQCHTRTIHNCYLDTTRDILATASQDHTARFYHFGTKQTLLGLEGHVRSVNDVCFTPHGIFTVSTDRKLRSVPNVLSKVRGGLSSG